MARKTYTSTEVKRRYNEQHYKQAHFRVSPEIGNPFKDLCRTSGISMRSVLIDIMTEYLEDRK